MVFRDPNLPRNTEKRSLVQLLKPTVCKRLRKKLCELNIRKLKKALLWLLQYGPARLTGTGACVFAEFDDEKSAQAVFQQKPKEFFRLCC